MHIFSNPLLIFLKLQICFQQPTEAGAPVNERAGGDTAKASANVPSESVDAEEAKETEDLKKELESDLAEAKQEIAELEKELGSGPNNFLFKP